MILKDDVFKAVVESLASSGKHVINPYHNHTHCYYVNRMGEQLLAHYGQPPSREFIWATLFHDYDHSGGEHTDDVNIDNAVNGVKEAIKTYNEHYDSETFDIEKIESLIRCTTYINGVFPYEPKTLEEECVRDADLMSISLSDDIALYFMKGLYYEIFKKIKMTPEEFSKNNIIFLKEAKYYTEPANMYVHDELDYKFKRIEELFLSS